MPAASATGPQRERIRPARTFAPAWIEAASAGLLTFWAPAMPADPSHAAPSAIPRAVTNVFWVPSFIIAPSWYGNHSRPANPIFDTEHGYGGRAVCCDCRETPKRRCRSDFSGRPREHIVSPAV